MHDKVPPHFVLVLHEFLDKNYFNRLIGGT